MTSPQLFLLFWGDRVVRAVVGLPAIKFWVHPSLVGNHFVRRALPACCESLWLATGHEKMMIMMSVLHSGSLLMLDQRSGRICPKRLS